MRTSILTVLAAALFAAGCAVDATKLACNSSTECPTGYHCDMAALKCASGAPSGNPTLSSFAWDKTLVQPADHATLTFTVSEPIDAAGFPPEVASHGITLGALTAVTTGAAATYTLAVNMPAACDGAGNNPVDDAAIPLSLAFTASGNRTGSGPIGSVACTVRKTLGANASKVRLIRQPYADGTVRTLISADPGAITSTPGFAGVSLAVVNGTATVAATAAQSDGSAQALELTGAPTQVSLAVLDHTGQRVNVTGYSQRVVLAFTGKPVTGSQNAAQAYDVGFNGNAMYPPQTWLASGPSPAGATTPPVEYATSVAPASGISNSYLGMATPDAVLAQSSLPIPPDSAYLYGWTAMNTIPTSTNFAATPPPRTGFSAYASPMNTAYTGGRFYTVTMYGGLDATGALADAPGTLWAYDPSVNAMGWSPLQVTTTTVNPGPYPSSRYSSTFGLAAPLARTNTAMGWGGNYGCTPNPCYNHNYGVLIAGGLDASSVLTDHLYVYGERVYTGDGSRYIGWWDESKEYNTAANKLIVPTAGAAYASQPFAPWPNPTANAGTTNAVVTILVGGQGVTAANNGPPAGGLGAGCQMVQTINYTTGPQFTVSSCTTSTWTTAGAAGNIGFRTGAAIAASQIDQASFYLFGGQRSNSGVAGVDGLQNDLWIGTLSVTCSTGGAPPCSIAGATQQLQITWTQVAVAGVAPAARSNAQIAFGGDYGHLLVYGGTTAAGAQQDLWEVDLTVAPTWKKLSVAGGAALGPGLRPGSVLVGNNIGASTHDGSNYGAYLIGGSSGGVLQSDVWKLAHESSPRLLFKFPTGIANPAGISNTSLSGTVFRSASSLFRFGLYVWDGSSWKILDQNAAAINAFTASSAGSYVQSDGNVYVLLEGTRRPTPGNAAFAPGIDALQLSLDFQ